MSCASFARQVAAQEKRASRRSYARPWATRPTARPSFDFGSATNDPRAFADTAAKLEDLAVAAYNGQATNVSPAILAAAATVVSVEARHAAWIRSISGDPPAPDATDTPQSADEVLKGLEQIGLKPMTADRTSPSNGSTATAPSPRPPMRRAACRGPASSPAGLAGAAVLLGAADAEEARAQKPGKDDLAILNFALTLEYLQAAFYTEAERLKALRGRTSERPRRWVPWSVRT